jgi:tRNA-modifying protein YgfZ
MDNFLAQYEAIRNGAPGFYKQPRGLVAVWGKEAVQFLNGMITNDVAKLEDGAQMMAAFPNAQGRLLALVRVLRRGDRFLFETDEVTREKVYNNLFRFTFAGDFFVEDMSQGYGYFEIFGRVAVKADDGFAFDSRAGRGQFVPVEEAAGFESELRGTGAIGLSEDLYELLRIENGVPKYGVDMDESTVVLETGLDEAVSFTKGCYIGQEIIARIHFRGHVAKRLTGLILDTAEVPLASEIVPGTQEITTPDGKNAGRITSLVMSPGTGKLIALALVRYDYLAEGTRLMVGETGAEVKNLPFFSSAARGVTTNI